MFEFHFHVNAGGGESPISVANDKPKAAGWEAIIIGIVVPLILEWLKNRKQPAPGSAGDVSGSA